MEHRPISNAISSDLDEIDLATIKNSQEVINGMNYKNINLQKCICWFMLKQFTSEV